MYGSWFWAGISLTHAPDLGSRATHTRLAGPEQHCMHALCIRRGDHVAMFTPCVCNSRVVDALWVPEALPLASSHLGGTGTAITASHGGSVHII